MKGTKQFHGNRVAVSRTNGTEYVRGSWELKDLTSALDDSHHLELDHGQYDVTLKCLCGYREVLWTKGY